MKEKDIVCVCNSITYGQIIEAIEKKGLKTVEEVGDATQAGTTCGACQDQIQEIIDSYYSKKEKK